MGIRLTRNGLGLLVASTISVIASTLIGGTELAIMGTFGLVLLGISTLAATTTGLHVQADRTLRPNRLHVGDSCAADIAITNLGRLNTANVRVNDHISTVAMSPVNLASISGRSRRSARYRFAATRRGIARLGPIRIVTIDPFGLCEYRKSFTCPADLVVLPRVVQLDAIPPASASDVTSGARHQTNVSSPDDEFSMLREYVPGDDVRRVHWPSTARHQRPIVRHYDQPWHQRLTVVLDTQAHGYLHETFETAICAVASAMSASILNDEIVSLVTSSGFHSGPINAMTELDRVMDHLATEAMTTSAVPLDQIFATPLLDTDRLLLVTGDAHSNAQLIEGVSRQCRALIICSAQHVALRLGITAHVLQLTTQSALPQAWSDAFRQPNGRAA